MNEDPERICKPAVFEAIFKKHSKPLRRFIFFKTQDPHFTEDILQDTFVKLWENCDNVTYSKVQSYLFAVANNLFLNSVKHTKVVRTHRKKPTTDRTIESPEFLLIEKEFLEKIEQTIALLPHHQRDVFLLNRIEKRKYKEISELLGISVKAVEKRMHHALKTMKEKIGSV
ncbi:MAG: sigma-70 family RNA polymerase sigma factor [Bacteroidota bacterium]